ncbi:A24 family peptidase [Ramlibacter algicola]|uniref:Prepilin peptidase n=1 Tax=Ramlibacter algicola TaxID=2795217 RepID=A0A934Q2M7_9BURK|nr:A24 family peptidase [Ramlibacter algicola]MBK0394003.1 prepilin peptidase [Ramlibacter algicola]
MDELRAFLDLLAMLVLDPRTGLLIALLVAAAVIDVRTMRIPNWLTVSGMVCGLLVSASIAPRITQGVGDSVVGALVGLVLLLPLWLVRVLGAGDVKLMAAVGAFLGPLPTLHALAYVAMAGGVAALLVAAWQGSLGRLLQNVYFIVGVLRTPAGTVRQPLASPAASVGKLPYGLCICIGTSAFLLARQFGLT